MLVVYDSQSTVTTRAAEAITLALGADSEALAETFTAEDGHRPLCVDPTRYDLAVVGLSASQRSVPEPVRRFLDFYWQRLRQVAFFATGARGDTWDLFSELATLAGQVPVACVSLTAEDLEPKSPTGRLQRFLKALPALPPVAPSLDSSSSRF
jgi:hypothetical protein